MSDVETDALRLAWDEAREAIADLRARLATAEQERDRLRVEVVAKAGEIFEQRKALEDIRDDCVESADTKRQRARTCLAALDTAPVANPPLGLDAASLETAAKIADEWARSDATEDSKMTGRSIAHRIRSLTSRTQDPATKAATK